MELTVRFVRMSFALPSILKIPKKLFLISSWFSLTFFTFLSAVFLFLSLEATGVGLVNISPAAYQLFGSLPKTGEVLGATIVGKDGRSEQLKNFLTSYNSPLTSYADTFVAVADRYQLPWTLLPAIAGKESGFGKIIPYGSYNAWGWGIHTGQTTGISFSSWEEGMEKVGKGIRSDYFNKGLDTPAKMEYRYTPPSASSHHSWRDDVLFLMDQLENWR